MGSFGPFKISLVNDIKAVLQIPPVCEQFKLFR